MPSEVHVQLVAATGFCHADKYLASVGSIISIMFVTTGMGIKTPPDPEAVNMLSPANGSCAVVGRNGYVPPPPAK